VGEHNGNLKGDANWQIVTDFPGSALRNVLHFNGTDNYVELVNSTKLGLKENSFTVEAWVKTEEKSDGSDQVILGTDTRENNKGLHLVIRGTKAYMGFYNNDLRGKTSLEEGKWYWIVWRYTKNTREQAIFINGG